MTKRRWMRRRLPWIRGLGFDHVTVGPMSARELM
jgi:hypothetical protein